MSTDRRKFLRMTANTTAAAAAFAALPLSIRKALAVPAAVETAPSRTSSTSSC
jgi:phospholipase C